MIKDIIMSHEAAMWEAAIRCDSSAFLEVVSESAVMVCGGSKCTGADYARIISEFDCKSYKISDFEVIAQSDDIVQVHYIIETVAEKPENQDLAGRFHITSTWKRGTNGSLFSTWIQGYMNKCKKTHG